MAPSSKKRSSEASFYNAGDNVEDESHPKKTKLGAPKQGASATPSGMTSKVDANGDPYWEISKLRRVTISTFRRKTMVNIREYYEKDGQELPGKKGISLPMDQYSSFVALLPEIEAVLQRNGQSVPRPDYSGGTQSGTEPAESSSMVEEAGSAKKNIEATSEEDEGDE